MIHEADQESLRRSEASLANALKIANLGVFEWNIKSGILLWSKETYRIFGQECGSFSPSTEAFYQQVHPEDLDEVLRINEESLKGDRYEVSFRIIRADGEERFLREQGQVFTDTDGQPVTMYGAIYDITEQKANELRVHDLNEELKLRLREREELISTLEVTNVDLKQKNAELERYAYTVSHDLKNPLVTIKVYAGMIERKLLDEDTSQIKPDLEVIVRAADQMNRLLNELLDLSKVGLVVAKPINLSLNHLVDEILLDMRGQTAMQEIKIEIQQGMPSVQGDRLRLAEVYQNLLDNAMKFRRHQTCQQIAVGATAREDSVLCWVRDNGIGIEARYHEKIFELFERLDHTVEGSGLGLALVKRIIEHHGGQIWAESSGQGQGCTIYFTLPNAESAQEVYQAKVQA